MRPTLLILFAFLNVVFFSILVNAQADKNKIVIINYYKFKFPDEVAVPEFDSLIYVYKKNVWDNNEYITNLKILRHLLGNRGNDFLLIYEVTDWNDVIKVNRRNNELFEKHWSSLEEREKFNEAFNKYFTVKYPDEIYNELITE